MISIFSGELEQSKSITLTFTVSLKSVLLTSLLESKCSISRLYSPGPGDYAPRTVSLSSPLVEIQLSAAELFCRKCIVIVLPKVYFDDD